MLSFRLFSKIFAWRNSHKSLSELNYPNTSSHSYKKGEFQFVLFKKQNGMKQSSFKIRTLRDIFKGMSPVVYSFDHDL